MICPKCYAQQPDSSKFCSQCAVPLYEPGHPGGKSKIPTWLAVVLVRALALVTISGLNATAQQTATQAASVISGVGEWGHTAGPQDRYTMIGECHPPCAVT